MRTVWQDVLFAIRTLRKSPGFLVTVLVILTLGIGVNTAIFSVVNAVVLRPLPYKNPDRIVLPWETRNGIRFATLLRNFTFLREQNRSFERLAAYSSRRFYITGIDRPHQDAAITVSPDLFPLLGVQPLLGRTFLPQEEQPGNDRVMVLSYAFWRDHLGATPDVVGKTVNLDDQSYTVVGVMPPEFRFPFRKHAFPFWVPLVVKESGQVSPIARLKKGVTLEQARAEMTVLAQHLRKMGPAVSGDLTAGVDRLLDEVLRSNRRLLWLMLGASGCVLLIACGNVANLFLARAGVRQREVALRVALGASRARVMRQMLTESILLSVAGGLLGLLVTFWTVKGLVGLCPASIPRLQEARVDTSVLVFTLAVSALTGLLFGMTPAWRATDVGTVQALKEGRGASAGGRGWRRLRGGLVVAQIGVSLVLLMGAGLLIRTLVALQKADLGFQPENMLTLHIGLPRVKYPEPQHCQAFFEPLVQQVRALPGVRAAGLVFDGFSVGAEGTYDPISFDGRPRGPDDASLARHMTVSPGFLEAMGMRVLKGRVFTDPDAQADAKSAVIDEHLARTYFPDTDPLGHKINGQTIIGVVSTLRSFRTLTPTHGTFFTPLSQSYSQYGDLVVRTEGDPMQLAGTIRSQVSALDKDQTAAELETMETTLSGMMAPRRFTMTLLGLFAGIALILAMIGVYGLLQYSTTRQTHDIGIRMALGARRMDVLRTVLAQGLRLTLIGVAVGLVGALALTRLLSSLLYGVTPADPLTFALVSLLLTAVALLASYLPARRAARIDPMVALRYE